MGGQGRVGQAAVRSDLPGTGSIGGDWPCLGGGASWEFVVGGRSMPESDGRPGWARDSLESLVVALGPLAGGLLLGISFRFPAWGGLAWVALIPFALGFRCRRHRAELYAGTFLGGAAFHFLALDFLRTDAQGMLSRFWVVQSYALTPFILGAMWCGRALASRSELPAVITLPLVWVAMESFRKHILGALMDFDFPFLQLGTTQVEATGLAQTADLWGIPGLTWLVAAVNGAIADVASVLRNRHPARRLVAPLALALVPLALSLGYGRWRLATMNERPGPTAAVLPATQMDLPVDEIARRIRSARDSTARPADLVVWPELGHRNSMHIFMDEGPSPGTHLPDAHPGLSRLTRMARALGSAMILGVSRSDPGGDPLHPYNSLVCFDASGRYIGSYDKIHLAPGYEYPPPLGRLVASLADPQSFYPQYLGSIRYLRGRRQPVFRLGGARGSAGFTFAGCICSDGYFPELFHAYLAPQEGRPIPDFFVNIANESMTIGTAWAALTDIRFRAIEC